MGEDLLGHLHKQQEEVLITEELRIHIESLQELHNGFSGKGDEKVIERQYYIELLQNFCNEFANESTKEAELKMQSLMNDLIGSKAVIDKKEIETLFNLVGLSSDEEKLAKHKASYIEAARHVIQQCKQELSDASNQVRKAQDSIKHSANHVENTLKPAIHAVSL